MSNATHNRKAIKKFRDELKLLTDDIEEVDKRCLNKAVNLGLKKVKMLTNVGQYTNPVEFYTRKGVHVVFNTSATRVGGLMRKGWRATPAIKKKGGGVQKFLVNNVDYSAYVNDGHVIRNKKGGPVKGFVKGQHMLEKTVKYIDKQLEKEFNSEIDRIKREHDC